METRTRAPLPTGMFFALIIVAWLAVTVVTTSVMASLGPSPGASGLRSSLVQAPHGLIAAWAAIDLLALGALLTRGRHPHACLVFIVGFLVAHAFLGPLVFHYRTTGFWIGCGGIVLALIGAWQLARTPSC